MSPGFLRRKPSYAEKLSWSHSVSRVAISNRYGIYFISMERLGEKLRAVRLDVGLTQLEAASRLGLRQPTLSRFESGRLWPTLRQFLRLAELYGVSPASLLGADDHNPLLPYRLPLGVSDSDLVASLVGHGYLGLAGPKGLKPVLPAELTLLGLLAQPTLEPRVVEGLPWLLLNYPMDRAYLGDVARLYNLQNRLGWTATVARQLAERAPARSAYRRRTNWLAELVAELERAQLAREDSLCHARLTERMKALLRQRRPEFSRRWNLLDVFRLEDFSRHLEPAA